ncbi:MAG: hypothetical protein KA734_04160 [Fluviicola sp.]|nr:hypothetical protein [Fluviicola sp.]
MAFGIKFVSLWIFESPGFIFLPSKEVYVLYGASSYIPDDSGKFIENEFQLKGKG